ncbi:hypothetical protein MMC22_012111 [Lobaria immixta]|nr:hypothetical protein [Lobaria immixta]
MALRAALQELTQNFIKAYEKLDADGIIAPRLPDCIHLLHPKSTGYPPMDNTALRRFTEEYFPHLENFKFIVHNIITDTESKQVVFRASSTADTFFGPYMTEYVFILHATEDGTKLKMVEEFLDSLTSTEAVGKIRAAQEAKESTA